MSRAHAFEIFYAGIASVKPDTCMKDALQIHDGKLRSGNFEAELAQFRNIYVAGSGKASAAMAREAEKILGKHLSSGMILTKYDHCLTLQKIKCLEAGHPVPDENGLNATRQMLSFLNKIQSGDLLIFLISGGASALLTDLPEELVLGDIQELNRLLLGSGANITEMNTLRKHLSVLKGGRLMSEVNGAKVLSLIISDVPGDDLSVIASGPTYPDASTFQDAHNILEKYHLQEKVPSAILRRIHKGLSGHVPETPKPGDPLFRNAHYNLIATNHRALEAAAGKAGELGYHPVILNDSLEGEARLEAQKFVESIRKYDGQKPTCLLMGGETTVTLTGDGRGGRNQEFALAALVELYKTPVPGVIILSGGTDGTDGPTDATGAIVDEELIERIKLSAMDPVTYLENNNAYPLFKNLNGLIFTGPTQTNVMDLVIGLIVH